MESQSYFFLLFTFILKKGQAEFLCLLSISAASQQTTEQATEELTNLFIKKKQNHFFSISAEICEALELLKGCKGRRFTFFHILLLVQI